jgi:hypothetical protein
VLAESARRLRLILRIVSPATETGTFHRLKLGGSRYVALDWRSHVLSEMRF